MAYQLSKAEKDLMIKVKENNKHVVKLDKDFLNTVVRVCG